MKFQNVAVHSLHVVHAPPPSKINHTQYDYSTADEIGMHLATNEYIGRCTFGKCTSLKIRWGAQEMTTCRLNCSLTHQYLHGGHVLNSYTQRNVYTQQMGIMCMHAEHTHIRIYFCCNDSPYVQPMQVTALHSDSTSCFSRNNHVYEYTTQVHYEPRLSVPMQL